MPSRELPKRAAFLGPRRRVYCDVPIEVIERYLEALQGSAPPERPSGEMPCPTSGVAPIVRQR
jgi:hypothetical protein